MQNSDLKSLVTQIHDTVLDKIDLEKNATKEQLVNYLKDAVSTIESIDESQLNSIDNAKSAFTNAYKEIAEKSLSSYKSTSSKFGELSKIQLTSVNELKEPHIDLETLTEKFNEIQHHMNEEVERANKVITELSDQVRTLEETSTIDALTKVYNRRSLISYLKTLCDKGDISAQLHFLILDIDDFKVVNDTYGHIAGDKILIYIANILKKILRDGDKIFRYGGEEFVIVLNRINDNQCQNITNRLLDLIRSNRLIYKGHKISVTASIGATKYISNDTPDSLIARADKALYKAKHSGKNKMYSDI